MYRQFFMILRQSHIRVADGPRMIEHISDVLARHSDLIIGLSTFLPPVDRIGCDGMADLHQQPERAAG